MIKFIRGMLFIFFIVFSLAMFSTIFCPAFWNLSVPTVAAHGQSGPQEMYYYLWIDTYGLGCMSILALFYMKKECH